MSAKNTLINYKNQNTMYSCKVRWERVLEKTFGVASFGKNAIGNFYTPLENPFASQTKGVKCFN